MRYVKSNNQTKSNIWNISLDEYNFHSLKLKEQIFDFFFFKPTITLIFQIILNELFLKMVKSPVILKVNLIILFNILTFILYVGSNFLSINEITCEYLSEVQVKM